MENNDSRISAVPAQVPTPITRDRVEAALKERDFKYFLDSDGDLGGDWDDHRFYFLFFGPEKEVFQTRGFYTRPLGIEARPTVLSVLDDFHREKLFPKLYTRIENDKLQVFAEHSYDYENGATDAQINMHLTCGISTTLEAFRMLDETLFGASGNTEISDDDLGNL